MTFLLSFIISSFYSLTCLGWGSLILKNFSYFQRSEFKNYILNNNLLILLASMFLTGTALVSILLTFLGLLGQLKQIPIILVLIPGIIGVGLNIKSVFKLKKLFFNNINLLLKMPLWLIIICSFTILLAIGTGLGALILPPKGDAAAFYMVYPKIIATTGLLEPMQGPFYFFSSIGLPVELHYTALMVLGDGQAAKFLIFSIALSAGVMLSGIVRECGGKNIAVIITWSMLLSSVTFHHYIYDGKVDLAAAAYGLTAVYWTLKSFGKNNSLMPFVLSGWFAGLATVAKFSYILAFSVSMTTLFIWLVIHNYSNIKKHNYFFIKFTKIGFLIIISFCFAWLPQLIKNLVLFGAPLAPFLGENISGNLLKQAWFSGNDTKKIIFTYPFALVFGRYPMQGGGLSFLFIAFIPFLFCLKKPNSWIESRILAVLFAGFMGILSWVIFKPSVIAPRYILTSLLLLTPIIAISAEKFLSINKNNKTLLFGTTLTTLLAILASFWHILPIPFAVIKSFTKENKTCMFASPDCSAYLKLSKAVNSGERVFIGSYYPYWLTSSQLQCRDTFLEQQEITSEENLVNWLKKNGFSYIIIDPNINRKLAMKLEKIVKNSPNDINEVYNDKVLRYYKINSDLSSAHIRCIETSPGRWILKRK